MMFCPSITQFERFLHTDQLITRLQVVVMTNFILLLSGNVVVNVFKTDAVIWWAPIFRILAPWGHCVKTWWVLRELEGFLHGLGFWGSRVVKMERSSFFFEIMVFEEVVFF